MHGFEGADPKVFDFLIGKEITQVAIGPHDVQLHYETGGISVWSKFTLLTNRGAFTWGCKPDEAKEIVVLVSTTITAVSFSKDAMLLKFSNGCELTILDDDPRYEALSISEKDLPLIVI